ncbi:hypothetical protein [Bremerella sp. P1]|uniref:hypothetical protein n=1 Tax=Bremerella sp. P1 TaxID=3026424 RepID=UPI0023677823|nr:hypothetical protein [Bremerella sp. P1]WDI42106.1 hypothetical protein PSR63_27000 [Bremerella sp. P1]
MKKTTVEQSLTLAIATFKRRLVPGTMGTVTWGQADGADSRLDFKIYGHAPRIVELFYRLPNGTDIEIPVPLQTTPVHLGGFRWWFTCPLTVNGKPCERRVGSLYLPPNSQYFGCRHCHNLSYKSSQTAHLVERYLAGIPKFTKWLIAVDKELSKEYAKISLPKGKGLA